MALYSLALAAALALASPWWIARMVTTERYREGLAQRLGRVPSALRAAVRGRRVVWLHAVSVGEVLAASRLVGELEAALGEGWLVVISTTTRTGQRLARERFGDDRVFYLPLDFAFAIRAYMRALRPAALVLMESELWPRLLTEAKRSGIPTIVANARMSDRSFARALKFKALWSPVLRMVTQFLAQSRQDVERLERLGAPAVRTTGNLKFDAHEPALSRLNALVREAAQGRRIVVAGSTLGENPSEDVPLIRAQQSLAPDERPLLVLAPRHPESFGAVSAIASEGTTVRATELLSDPTLARRAIDIVVVDTIGDLASLYAVADLAFIGGSLLRRGGHNPLEAARFGVPVFMGPSFENFRAIVASMQAAEAIAIIGVGLRPDARNVTAELSQQAVESIAHALRHLDKFRAMGDRGRDVFLSQQGATQRTVDAIVALLPPEAAR